MRLAIVLVGVPDGVPVRERYAARGYDVLATTVRADADPTPGLAAVRAAIDELRSRADAGKVAVVGYGFGGRYAFLAVTRLGAEAAAAFAASGIGQHLDEAARAAKPLSLHFGDADPLVPLDEVRAVKGALEGFPTTEIYRYPGAGSDFARPGAPGYHAASAAEAERRVVTFLDGVQRTANGS
jgi:dienelactone hydrolase